MPANTVDASAGSTEESATVAAKKPVSTAFLPDSMTEWGTALATTARPGRVFEAFEGAASALDAVCVTANMARVRCTVPYPTTSE